MRSRPFLALVSLLVTLSLAAVVEDLDTRDNAAPRLAIYYQTTHDSNGNPISLLPLIDEQGIALTHLFISSLHIDENGIIHLNDDPPAASYYYTMWNETKILKKAGVQIMGMLGGAGVGSYSKTTLDSSDHSVFEHYYDQLHHVIHTYGLQGLDLDVEEPMSQSGIARLIRRLHSDFGPNFHITMAPVATAMSGGSGLSGFSYDTVKKEVGADVAFYNVQFYNGWGSMDTPADYEAVINHGYNPTHILAGQVTSPVNGGDFVPYPRLNHTIVQLRKKYGRIGGIMGWEYYNSNPGGTAKPWEWAQHMTQILGKAKPTLTVTPNDANILDEAYEESRSPPRPNSNIRVTTKPDYEAMANTV